MLLIKAHIERFFLNFSYTKEAVFGQGKSKLQCMSEDCEAGYPRDMMERVLSQQTIDKFEELAQYDALQLAEIENLFKYVVCLFEMISTQRCT